MSLKPLILRQYQDTVNRSLATAKLLDVPPEGWLRTARKALGMSGTQLARRLGASRALVSNTERAELEGGVTLRNMRRMAEAMGYRFVYGLVPDESADAMRRRRAWQLARKEVAIGSVHMALEEQALGAEQEEDQVRRLAQQLINEHDSQLWDEP